MATSFDAETLVVCGNERTWARDTIGVLSLSLPKGAEMEILTVGNGAKKALSAMVSLVEEGFGEY